MLARYLPDGSCEVVDDFHDTVTSWTSPVEWAQAWVDEWRRDVSGPASDFINAMTADAVDGVVPLLTVLADCTDGEERSWVGAGPIEDLLSHSGHGRAVIDEVERAARRHAAFRAAVGNVWLGKAVDAEVRARLVALGARDLTNTLRP